ncbi:nucleotidyltransferase domain-containing protein [Planococcus sp. N028]|uniref:Nucleotidyltransferase domain-containing protein n=1 Tax=Planococcus shixiaomingii TaxID=3058393 RepID=A0ABT8N3F6_9BACL|nr:nucleotidyltransferase domain-containing protein [Planococcus sp. N028]MDN7242417.1 nucleotidyltransferase domain-containing protein [Planococcus sp. N028]
MNSHSKWRLDFAQQISRKLEGVAGVRAVMVGGSVARGYSDVYSDLEILVYWDEMPSVETQRSIAKNLNALHRYPVIDHGHESALLINGFPVDIWHRPLATEEASINKVLRGYSTSLDESNVLDTLRFGVPLYGGEMIQPWKNRIEAYPTELAVCILKEQLPNFHLRQLQFAVLRDNPNAVYSMLSSIQTSVFVILLALNRSYFPTFKWMFKRLDDLPLAPKSIGVRLRQMYRESPAVAAVQLHEVLTETLALVQQQHPHLNTEIAQYGLDQLPPKAFDEKILHTEADKKGKRR